MPSGIGLPPPYGDVVAGERSLARWVAAVLVAFIGVFLVAGCASSQGGGNNSLGATALQNLSPFEKGVLADKHVTEAELDQSMRVYTECLTAAGLKYQIQPGQAGMGSVWVIQTGKPGPDSDAAMERCTDEVNAVENVWILQNHVGAADLATMQAKFISCLRDAGLPIKDGATFLDAESAESKFMTSLPGQYDDDSPVGVTADKVDTCQQNYQKVSGAQPLPGLQEALTKLDTSGW